MRVPNSMMRNLLSGVFTRSDICNRLFIYLFSGGPLTDSERAILSSYTDTPHIWATSTIIPEIERNRTRACVSTCTVSKKAIGISKGSIALSEMHFTHVGYEGVDIGLMLVILEGNANACYAAIALTVGEVGTGADVEMSSTIATKDMCPVYRDVVLNFT